MRRFPYRVRAPSQPYFPYSIEPFPRWSMGTTLLLTVLMALIASCSPSPPRQIEKIVLGAVTVVHSSPVWIAESRDYFEKEGLKVEIKGFDSGRNALWTMLNAEGIDIVTVAQMPIVFNSFDRSDFAIIGTMVHSDKDNKLLVRQDRVKIPRDLKGKSVGVTANTSGHYFLGRFLSYHRLNLSDIKTVDMDAERLSQALIEGQVDAIATWDPHIYNAQKALGNHALLLPGEGVFRMNYYFVARKDFITNRPDALTRFLRAIQRSNEFIEQNKKEAMDIVEKRLNMERNLINSTWDDFRFSLSLDQPILESLEDLARWARRNRLKDSSKTPNYLDYLYTDALKAVSPAAVAIAGK
ncbi:MAG: ABC transporter substrate-binding protein [Thermodesulfobacteriota bacterium]